MKKALLGIALLVVACRMFAPRAAVTPTQVMTQTPPSAPSQTPTLTSTSVPPSATPFPTPTPTQAPTMTPEPSDFIDDRGALMRLVPAGSFPMGSDRNLDEKPVNRVYLDAFYIDKFEVTNAEYRGCVDTGVCRPPGSLAKFDDPHYSDHPVVYVDWLMANTYCFWRGGRLPTEAEWEKAASWNDVSKKKVIYPWGNEKDCTYGNISLGDSAYCVEDTTPVGNYPLGRSPYGLFDMAGNVDEWTSSLYLPYPYNANDGREDILAPGNRTLRGGTFYGQSATTTYRSFFGGNRGWEGIGFRCARDANP